MRVLFLLTQDIESPSGLGRYFPIARELVKQGYDVEILATHSNFCSISKRSFKKDGVQIRYVAQMHVRKVGNLKTYFKPLSLLWNVVISTFQLMRYSIRTPMDAIHIGKAHPMNGIAGLITGRLRKVPIYLDCDDYEAASNRFSSKLQKMLVAFVEDNIARLVDGITTNTEFTRSRLESIGIPIEKIVYVPNGFDKHRFEMNDSHAIMQIRERIGLTIDQNVVLFVGSISLISHPIDLLIEGYPQVLHKNPETKLLVVGGGEDINHLKDLVSSLGLDDQIIFIGRVSPTDIVHYYRLADVSVDPIYDNLEALARHPLKIVESLAVGTPVVTSPIGDRSKLMTKIVIFVEAGNPSALADGINYALANKSKYQSRSDVEPQSWETIIDTFCKIYTI